MCATDPPKKDTNSPRSPNAQIYSILSGFGALVVCAIYVTVEIRRRKRRRRLENPEEFGQEHVQQNDTSEVAVVVIQTEHSTDDVPTASVTTAGAESLPVAQPV